MRFVSVFSGIGGIDLGLERAGMECVGQVENDPWCNQILKKHWSAIPRWEDIHDLDPKELPDHDLIAGGFPCQPVSLAGARLGYDTEWQSIPAAFVGAPHLRWRIFIVAYPAGDGDSIFSKGFGGESAMVGSVVGASSGVAGGDFAEGVPQRGGAEFDGTQDAAHSDSKGESSQSINAGSRSGELVLADAGSAGGGRVGRMARDVGDSGRGAAGAKPAVVRPGDGEARPDGIEPGGSPLGDPDQSSPNAFAAESGSRRTIGESSWWAVEPDVGRVAHGIPRRVDRLRGLGNAVVPQVAELVGRLIMEADRVA